jgi:hypothetical protein
MARVRHENASPPRKDVSESTAWEGCEAKKFGNKGEAQAPGGSTHKSRLACLPGHILTNGDFAGRAGTGHCIFTGATAKRAFRAAFHAAAHFGCDSNARLFSSGFQLQQARVFHRRARRGQRPLRTGVRFPILRAATIFSVSSLVGHLGPSYNLAIRFSDRIVRRSRRSDS